MTALKPLFAALAVLPLLAACDEAPGDNAANASEPAITERAPDALYDIDIAGSALVAAEFTPQHDKNETCIYVSPKKTWDGSAQDCFAKAESGKFYSGTSGPVTYTLPIGATMYVLEFSPRTAPHVNCVYMSPARSWTGSTLKCTPR